MWIYSQSSGQLWDGRGLKIDVGYSGKGESKNNPTDENRPNCGPIPRGHYVIGAAYNSENVGPFALPLTPHEHNALGRTAFAIHGENKEPPYGDSSEGCPIFNRVIRGKIHASRDKLLLVIE